MKDCPGRHYTIEDVAAIMGTHPGTVQRWIDEDKLETLFLGHGTGKGHRISHATLVAYIKERWPGLTIDENEDAPALVDQPEA